MNSEQTLLTNNIAEQVWDGFDVTSDGGMIVNNTARNNDNLGIFIGPGSANMVLIGNTANDNDVGFYLRGDELHVENTVAENNANYGIWMSFSIDTTVVNASVTGNDEGILIAGPANNSVLDSSFVNNGIGIHVTSSGSFYEISNNTAVDNDWDFQDDSGITYTVQNLDIGDSTAANTTLTFDADYVSLRGNASTQPTNPDADDIGRYFDAEATGGGTSKLDVELHYEPGDVTGVDENASSLWKFNGTAWEIVNGSGVDTSSQVVTATITEFSTFGAFAGDGSSDVGTIAGNVTDADTNDPIENATVWILDGDTGVASNTTNSSGGYAVDVAAGTYNVSVDADGYEEASREDVLVEAENATSLDVSLTPEAHPIVSTSLVHVGGTETDLDNVSLEVFVESEMLQVQLVNDTAPMGDLETQYELAGVGANETTVFEIEIQVDNFTPRVLVGSGNVSDWNVTANGDGTTNVTITVSPISEQTIVDCVAYPDGCTPPLNDWPEGADDTATVANDATVSLAADPLGTVDAAFANVLNGTVLTTDAQAFGSPAYDPVAEDLSVFVAAPSLTVDDEKNEGFYAAFLPDSLLGEWGVTSAGELEAAFQGEATDFDATNVAGGIEITIDMSYSAGFVSISTVDASGTSSSGGSSTSASSSSQTPTLTPTPTATSTPTSTSAPTSTATSSPSPTPTSTQVGTPTQSDDAAPTTQSSTPGQPGFGFLTPLIALLAAALLVLRRTH